MRLNRYLARAGVASRRKSDDLILAGRVRVNGETVAAPGRTVAANDEVEVEDRRVELPLSSQYLLLNKLPGTLVTKSDARGRTTVFDGVENLSPGTVAVGRLDKDTTGVLLLTDDGELAHRLMHPRFEVEKRYEAVVYGLPSFAALERLRGGVVLEDGVTAPAQVRVIPASAGGICPAAGGTCELELCVHEGRKHQIKRMCAAVGHRVKSLHRAGFAGLTPDGVAAGRWRPLRPQEVEELKSLVGLTD